MGELLTGGPGAPEGFLLHAVFGKRLGVKVGTGLEGTPRRGGRGSLRMWEAEVLGIR